MTCSTCGESVPATATRCAHCGEAAPGTPAVAPVPGELTRSLGRDAVRCVRREAASLLPIVAVASFCFWWGLAPRPYRDAALLSWLFLTPLALARAAACTAPDGRAGDPGRVVWAVVRLLALLFVPFGVLAISGTYNPIPFFAWLVWCLWGGHRLHLALPLAALPGREDPLFESWAMTGDSRAFLREAEASLVARLVGGEFLAILIGSLFDRMGTGAGELVWIVLTGALLVYAAAHLALVAQACRHARAPRLEKLP